MDIMQQIILFIGLFISCCFCQNTYFQIEHEDTRIIKTKDDIPFLNKSVDSETECYMKCLNNQDNCCVIELKVDEVNHQCFLYNISSAYMKKTFEKNSKIASVIGRDCEPKRKPAPKPKSCLEWHKKGKKEDGLYEINVNGNSTKVFCDMVDGGWTVFQRRINGSVNFTRTWDDYKFGFGDPIGEHWLGNEIIHQLTNKADGTSIKFKTTSFYGDVKKYIIFKGFKIDNEKDKYKMYIGDVDEGDEYLIKNEDRITSYNGAYFSTTDQDNDAYSLGNCAQKNGGGGGYWFKYCSDVTPNSRYPTDIGSCDSYKCMRWYYWKKEENYTYLKFFQISIK